MDEFVESRRVHLRKEEGRVVVRLRRTAIDVWIWLGFWLAAILLGIVIFRFRRDAQIGWGGAALLLATFLFLAGWQVFYTETLELSPQRLVLSKKLWGIGTTETFDLDKIRNFRYNEGKGRYNPCSILFDHDLDLGLSQGFAGPINRIEAVNLIKAIEAYIVANLPATHRPLG